MNAINSSSRKSSSTFHKVLKEKLSLQTFKKHDDEHFALKGFPSHDKSHDSTSTQITTHFTSSNSTACFEMPHSYSSETSREAFGIMIHLKCSCNKALNPTAIEKEKITNE